MYEKGFRYFSTFTGIGGFELGIEKALSDFERSSESAPTRRHQPDGNCRLGRKQKQRSVCVGFSEVDKYAVQIYQRHFPDHTNYGDITKIAADALPDFDLFCGGFPCQAFSIAGKRRGFDDTRGTLFFDIARILKAKHPRLLLLENVKGLLSHDNGNTFKTIISTLDELGYDLQWQVLNSKDFGVPQNRERVFIVGHLRGTPRPEVFPLEPQSPSDRRLLKTAYGRHQQDVFHEIDGLMQTLQVGAHAQHSHLTKIRDTRIDAEPVAQIRRLTPTECERLQGFPDGWTEGVSDTQRYKTLGNAVTVNVIEAIATRLLGA